MDLIEKVPEIPSSEFRRTFQRLRAHTNVTVNGHIIGSWVPRNEEGAPFSYVVVRARYMTPQETQAHDQMTPEEVRAAIDQEGRKILSEGIPSLTQAERDRILRKINRGG